MNNKIFPWINESLCITLAVGCVLGSEVRLQGLMTGPGVTANMSGGYWSPSGQAAEVLLYDAISVHWQSSQRRPDDPTHSDTHEKMPLHSKEPGRMKKIMSDPELACLFYYFFSSSKQCTCTTIQTDSRTPFEVLLTNSTGKQQFPAPILSLIIATVAI